MRCWGIWLTVKSATLFATRVVGSSVIGLISSFRQNENENENESGRSQLG